MPLPMYFFPFADKAIDSGFVGNISAKTALHGVAPTFGRKTFAYLWKLGKNSTTFAHYTSTKDRIYVLGHCDAGTDTLSTGILGPNDTCSASELAAYFHKHGLPKASGTHIRIHACHSGEASGGSLSFAEELKNEMVTLGYKNATIRGYRSGMGYYFVYREGGDHFWSAASAAGNLLQFDPPLA